MIFSSRVLPSQSKIFFRLFRVLVSGVDYMKLCEKCDDEEDDVEDEEKYPIFPTQVEPIQGNEDKRQDQGQTQRSRKDPCQ